MRQRGYLGFGVIAVVSSTVKSQRPHKQADFSRRGSIAVEGLCYPGYPVMKSRCVLMSQITLFPLLGSLAK